MSIGRSSWDNNSISAKIWRWSEEGERWSRQSEDVPLWRLLDMAILFIATLKEKRSILGEVLVNNSDENYLREMLREEVDLYTPHSQGHLCLFL